MTVIPPYITRIVSIIKIMKIKEEKKSFITRINNYIRPFKYNTRVKANRAQFDWFFTSILLHAELARYVELTGCHGNASTIVSLIPSIFLLYLVIHNNVSRHTEARTNCYRNTLDNVRSNNIF